jgi:putative oxidoreductase
MARLSRSLIDPAWSGGADGALLASRLVIGAFLLWGVADNILSSARMAEFAQFLAANGFPIPHVMATLSVWVQALVGVALILGLFTRWAGLLCAINFAVAVAMVDAKLGVRGAFPATALVLFGLLFATLGGGRHALDRRVR